MHTVMLTTTNGAEAGQAEVRTMVAGTYAARVKVASGVVVGAPSAGDKGVGSGNFQTLWINGVQLSVPNIASQATMEAAKGNGAPAEVAPGALAERARSHFSRWWPL